MGKLREQAWRFLCATFPERQIYIRSDGRVQFFTFGPLMQTILASITLVFLGWVAFTSVNVVFKDHIIATKDRRYHQMLASYETRVSDLQFAYDELNNALVSAEDHFKARAGDLEAKGRTLYALIQRKQVLQATANSGALLPNTPATTAATDAVDAQPVPTAAAAGDSIGSEDETGASFAPPPAATTPALRGATNPNPQNSGAQITPRVKSPAPAPRSPATSPSRASFLEGAVEKLASVFKRNRAPSAAILDHPALRQIALEQKHLEQLEATEQTLTAEAEQSVAGAIDHLQRAIRVTGINPSSLVERENNEQGGVGGPLIPLPASVISGVQDAGFNDHVLRITAELDDLADVVNAMRSVPLTMPVIGDDFHRSSGFGARVDPFTKRLAFHAGLDFTGPWGSTIHATAPGIVVYAGPRGPYGNCVEIDHGMGIRTRYGHMSAILVQPGIKVSKGTPIGRLGSSGRSTGPHVHYEVWYDDAVRDPNKFIEAGRYVLTE